MSLAGGEEPIADLERGGRNSASELFFSFLFFFFLIRKGSGDSWGSAGFKEARSWVLDSHKWRGV